MKAILSGAIVNIFPSEIIGSGFEKRVFWLVQTDVEKYPQTWALECWQGDANLLEKYKAGDLVSCHIEIRGKEWSKNGRTNVFNSLKCWKIERVGIKGTATKLPTPPAKPQPPADDDLPF